MVNDARAELEVSGLAPDTTGRWERDWNPRGSRPEVFKPGIWVIASSGWYSYLSRVVHPALPITTY